MHLNPYGRDPVLLAADLVNDPPSSHTELADRCLEAGLTPDWTVQPADLGTVRILLGRWTAVVDAEPGAARARLLNELLAAGTGPPRLTDHDGHWHLHYRDDGLDLPGVLHALIATGTALHLTARGMDRLGRCAAPACDRVFADVSRNGRQRYCSPRCGNTDAVRRHRDRRSPVQA
ncbi:CGNR zinc finger domain-containing protein [Pseudonocardia phyllosphaerae]|uniref:CGNR zinc finger domain-containing protein n=1 Tax=Pseudonocardia phyllosphaerae TaxID=3390502 RepID=UPI00397883E2